MCRTDVWQLGKLKFLVETHELPYLSGKDEQGGAHAENKPEGEDKEKKGAQTQARVYIQAKMEYHSQKAAQGELITDRELARWWLGSVLHQNASVWVISLSEPPCCSIT